MTSRVNYQAVRDLSFYGKREKIEREREREIENNREKREERNLSRQEGVEESRALLISLMMKRKQQRLSLKPRGLKPGKKRKKR